MKQLFYFDFNMVIEHLYEHVKMKCLDFCLLIQIFTKITDTYIEKYYVFVELQFFYFFVYIIILI